VRKLNSMVLATCLLGLTACATDQVIFKPVEVEKIIIQPCVIDATRPPMIDEKQARNMTEMFRIRGENLNRANAYMDRVDRGVQACKSPKEKDL
jgi:hypothetical protein